MLKVAKHQNQLNFSELMAVYTQSNQEDGKLHYPGKEAPIQLVEVEQDFYGYLREFFSYGKGNLYMVWEEEGKYLSALRLETYEDGYLLAGLETHPGYRRKGYAKKLIDAVFKYLRGIGVSKLYSHVSARNSASLRIHETCGFQKILDHAVYIDGSVSTDAVTFLRKLD